MEETNHSEDSSLIITIPSQSLNLKTIMHQIQKRQSFKKHFFLNIKTCSPQQKLLFSDSQYYVIPQLQLTLSKALSHCSFMNLTVLYFFEFDFDSCEFMGFLDAPQLKQIHLSNNKLTNFKSLVKMSLPSLVQFHIENNLAKKTFLERAKLSKNGGDVILEDRQNGFVIEEDLRSLVKFEPDFYDNIIIVSNHRVKRDLIKNKLEQRFVWQDRVVKFLE